MTAALLLWGSLADAQNIFTVAGIPYTHRNDVDSHPALNAPLGSVYGLLIDRITGRLILNDELMALRLEPDGTLLALAGSGSLGFREPLPAVTARTLASTLLISVLRGMAEDSTGALYVSDAGFGRVYRVGRDGIVTTFAGGGIQSPGAQSDGGPATAARVQSPRGLVFDSKGNLDIAEVFCNCIRQVTPGGVISTLYTFPPSQPPMRVLNLEGLAIDAQDNLYVTEWFGNAVVKIASDGSAATAIAGTGTQGFSGDGGPAATAQLNGPSGVALDGNGNIYIADTRNHRIRRVAADGTISTIAGTGTCGFSGDGGPAAAAMLCNPAEILLDRAGNLLIADFGNQRVREIASDGIITTIAGSGKRDPGLFLPGSSGNGGPPIHATFNLIGGAAFDSTGNLYVSEALGNVIRKIAPDGAVSTFAGAGQRGYSGDGGPAIEAEIFGPGPLSVGPDNAVYVITGESRIRRIAPDGNISLVAGTGTGTGLNRSQGDGGPAINATLNEPGEVAFDPQGNIYIADTSNARVRKIDRNGVITTVAGPGQQGVDYYNGVAVDPGGNLYVAWTHAAPPAVYATVNRVNADGSLTRVAGNGEPCMGGPLRFTGEGLPATQVRLCAVIGLAVDKSGLLYLSEGSYSLVLRLNSDGTIQRMAGSTPATRIGDGGPALQASLAGGQGWSPQTVTFNPAGTLFISEPGLNYIREVTPAAYQLALSPDRISAAGREIQTRTIGMSANFAEPFPCVIRATTSDGASWLTVNRTTGFTGDAVTVTINPTGLARGAYQGTVSVLVMLGGGDASLEVDVPVSLVVP